MTKNEDILKKLDGSEIEDLNDLSRGLNKLIKDKKKEDLANRRKLKADAERAIGAFILKVFKRNWIYLDPTSFSELVASITEDICKCERKTPVMATHQLDCLRRMKVPEKKKKDNFSVSEIPKVDGADASQSNDFFG